MNKRMFLKLIGIGVAVKAACQKVWAFPFLTDRKCDVGDNSPEDKKQPNVDADPHRRSGSRWNFEGRWNPSKGTMIAHLRDDHGVKLDLKDYSTSELRIIHDNVHNGYGPLGDGCGRGRTVRSPSRRRGWFWR